jgi:hypothetical protein
MKAIVTKYATTSGVVVLEGQQSKEFPAMFRPDGWMSGLHGKDWHLGPGAAERQIEELFRAKEKSLRKQLENLGAKKKAALDVVDTYIYQEQP